MRAGAAAMTRFPFDIVGFDLDGTLVDTRGDLTDAVNHALATLGRAPVDPEQVTAMIGRGTRHMLGRALEATGGSDDTLIEAAYPALLAFYESHIARHSRPYPGVRATLDALADRGVMLAIVTNKPERLAARLLDALELTGRFACVIGGDTLDAAKPSPVPIREMVRRCGGGRAAFVGDSIFDIQAAQAAGLPAILAAYGYLDRPVQELGADAMIERIDALVPALGALAN
jgi:phosphoglycolate phosphatase